MIRRTVWVRLKPSKSAGCHRQEHRPSRDAERLEFGRGLAHDIAGNEFTDGGEIWKPCPEKGPVQ
jgi:hypothetical protein